MSVTDSPLDMIEQVYYTTIGNQGAFINLHHNVKEAING
jgi:hypothetical protein